MERRHRRQRDRVEPVPVVLAQHRDRGACHHRRDLLLEIGQLLDPGDRPQRPAHVHRHPQAREALGPAVRYLPVQPARRRAGAERLPGQQRPLAPGRRHLPGRHRRADRDPAPRQLRGSPLRAGVTEPYDLQPAGQPVPDERGSQVEQLLAVPERQARVIIHRQVSYLRVSPGLHTATSARAAPAHPGAAGPRATDKTVARPVRPPHRDHCHASCPPAQATRANLSDRHPLPAHGTAMHPSDTRQHPPTRSRQPEEPDHSERRCG